MGNPGKAEDNAATQKDEQLMPEQRAEIAEKRHKDTQAAYTKGQQELKRIKAEKEALEKLLKPEIHIPDEEKQELEELMYEDPKSWRQKMNELEDRATAEHNQKIEETLQAAGQSASSEYELERRKQALEKFNQESGLNIDDDVIENDIPARITKKLASGDIEFDEFLEQAKEYLTTGKVIKNGETLGQPNMGNFGGGNTPKEDKAEVSLSESYKHDIY